MSETHAFKHEPRLNFSDQKRARIFLERGGKCHKCQRKLGSGDDWILEHIIALQNGGTNDEANMGVTCGWCLPAKNKTDAGLAAKGRAIATAHVVPRKRRTKSALQKPEGKKWNWKSRRYENVP